MSDLLPSVVLDRAADLIEPEGAWTQHVYARRANGEQEDEFAKGAVCWCARGAMRRISGDYSTGGAERYLNKNTGFAWTPDFNDHPDRTQAEVVTALRQAAELARSEGR